MLARALDRGHFDIGAPAFRIVLHAQPAPLAQAALFASTSIEPSTEPPCDHPEAGWQADFFGECVYCCTFCGAEMPEPEVASELAQATRMRKALES